MKQVLQQEQQLALKLEVLFYQVQEKELQQEEMALELEVLFSQEQEQKQQQEQKQEMDLEELFSLQAQELFDFNTTR